jgi:Rieske 2Fe-2S family protein
MAQQILAKEAYTSQEWFENERKQLFSKTWSMVGLVSDFSDTGDYITATIANNPIAVVQDGEGNLRAFHNLCRHRGTELLEGKGNAGKTLVCPYHRWTYGLDGALRGLPNRSECFPDLDRKGLSLMDAGVGVWKGIVFANPDPAQSFENWISPMKGAEFPHDITDASLIVGKEFVYKMKCNWKVFFENAIDGYHLAYLHENTLGGPLPALNEWQEHGQNLVWYSTERDGIRNRIPKFVEDQASKHSMATIKGAENSGYGGVYMMFPTTLITPSPWSLTISRMEPINAETTLLRAQTWVTKSWFTYQDKLKDVPGYSPDTGLIESDYWTQHPLETGDFQTEDIWVCEKMQRSLSAEKYAVGPLAVGSGAEDMLPLFQKNVQSYL